MSDFVMFYLHKIKKNIIIDVIDTPRFSDSDCFY